MQIILKVWAADRPGALDRIAGLIRRKGWNISSITAGNAQEGLSQISLALEGKDVDAGLLGEHLDELDGISRWEECAPESHCIRELLLFSAARPLPDAPGVHEVGGRGGLVYAEYSGAPHEVDRLLGELGDTIKTFVRTGPLAMAMAGEEERA